MAHSTPHFTINFIFFFLKNFEHWTFGHLQLTMRTTKNVLWECNIVVEGVLTAQNVLIWILTFCSSLSLIVLILKIRIEFTVGASWFHGFRHRSAFSHVVYLHIQRPNRWNYHLMSIFHFFPRVDRFDPPIACFLRAP